MLGAREASWGSPVRWSLGGQAHGLTDLHSQLPPSCRVAFCSCCTRLRTLSSSNAQLWGALELAAPAHRLQQLAAWLRTRRGVLRTLSLSISPPAGAWPPGLNINQDQYRMLPVHLELVAAVKVLLDSLQGAAQLHSLR